MLGPDVELVASPVDNAAASATHLSCLQLPNLDALTRSGDYGGHIRRGISHILRARAYFTPMAFCNPSPPDYMRAISSAVGGALALFIASNESNFKVPSDRYTMASRRVLGLIVERASHVQKCPQCNEAPSESCGYGSLSTVSGTSMSDGRSTRSMLMDHIHVG
jgi:hypothetical protein